MKNVELVERDVNTEKVLEWYSNFTDEEKHKIEERLAQLKKERGVENE